MGAWISTPPTLRCEPEVDGYRPRPFPVGRKFSDFSPSSTPFPRKCDVVDLPSCWPPFLRYHGSNPPDRGTSGAGVIGELKFWTPKCLPSLAAETAGSISMVLAESVFSTPNSSETPAAERLAIFRRVAGENVVELCGFQTSACVALICRIFRKK